MRKPYDYQKRIIERSISRPFTMVQAACGTGKSLIAGQTAIGKGKTTLIITPKNIMDDFKAELIADGVKPENIFVYRAAESHKENYYEDFAHWLEAMAYAEHTGLLETSPELEDEEVIF